MLKRIGVVVLLLAVVGVFGGWSAVADKVVVFPVSVSPQGSCRELFAGGRQIQTVAGTLNCQVALTVRTRGNFAPSAIRTPGSDIPVSGPYLYRLNLNWRDRASRRPRIQQKRYMAPTRRTVVNLVIRAEQQPVRITAQANLMGFLDERQAPDEAPAGCAALEHAFNAEYQSVRSCTHAAQCGQSIRIGCGGTRNPVARLDADLRPLYAAEEAALAAGCNDLPLVTTCDLPPADGFACSNGICQWNYLAN